MRRTYTTCSAVCAYWVTSLRSLMLCDAGWRGPVPGRTSGWGKTKARSGSHKFIFDHVHNELSLPYTTRIRRNERSQLHGTACHANRLQRPCSLFALFIRQTAQPRKLSRVDPGDAEPTRAAARGFVGPRCATKSLRGCFTASASSACRSLHGRRHTVGVARGRAHVLRQATLSARRRPRERGRTCAVGPSDSFSDNQNWPERISSLT